MRRSTRGWIVCIGGTGAGLDSLYLHLVDWCASILLVGHLEGINVMGEVTRSDWLPPAFRLGAVLAAVVFVLMFAGFGVMGGQDSIDVVRVVSDGIRGAWDAVRGMLIALLS